MGRKRKRRGQEPTLDGVQVKLDRARSHIGALDGELARVFPKGTYIVAPEVHEKGRKHVYRAKTPPQLDPNVSAIVGDCLHNLRSALDHLVYQLVRQPNTRTQFPILDRPPRKRLTKKLTLPEVSGGASIHLRQAIETVQPYKRRDLNHGLNVLRDLNNIDKHRTLLVAAAGPAGHITSSVGAGWPKPGPEITTTFTGRPLEHGEVLAILTYDPPQSYGDPNLKLIPVITFGEGAPHVVGDSVIGVLIDMVTLIEQEVLKVFRQFF